ncbi:hypothetical protein ACTXT7_015115 [Hymenolepis weldensis]
MPAPTLPSHLPYPSSLSLSLSYLNPHRSLFNTFWPSQLLVFYSKTVATVFLHFGNS